MNSPYVGATFLFFFGIVLLLIGIYELYNTEAAWKREQFHRRANGRNDQRTPEWDILHHKGAKSTIIMGICLMVVGGIVSSLQSQRQHASNDLWRTKIGAESPLGGHSERTLTKDEEVGFNRDPMGYFNRHTNDFQKKR